MKLPSERAELQTGTFAQMETGPPWRITKWEKYKYIECIVHPPFELLRHQLRPRQKQRKAFQGSIRTGIR